MPSRRRSLLAACAIDEARQKLFGGEEETDVDSSTATASPSPGRPCPSMDPENRLLHTSEDSHGSGSRKKSVDDSVHSSNAHDDADMLREKQFLLSCERGDIGSVRKLLELTKTDALNINCVDPLGRNALLIAIENENIEMIELLLDHNIETGDAILYAIGEENVEAVEIILEHLEKIDKFNPETQGVEINEHSAFTPDITPIILAAHKDNYEIIKLFLDKRATVPHPHDVKCCCPECTIAKEEDSLRLSRSRINAYRALTSPSFICLKQKNPILYAFELSWELRRLSYPERELEEHLALEGPQNPQRRHLQDLL